MKTKAVPNNRMSVSWLNGLAMQSPEWLVSMSEGIYRAQIDQAAKNIAQRRSAGTVLLVSGPSASTKTTTSAKVSARLKDHGVNSVVISLDNFFRNRSDLPVEADGSIDFEALTTVDLPKLHECIEVLRQKKVCDFPIFDFKHGCRAQEVQRVKTDDETILILEGIHALNPAIAKSHDPADFLKIYISPDTDYYLDDRLIMTNRQVRLIRRMVRDYYHRGNPVGRTFDMWKGVVSSELVNIIPFRTEADYIIDSTIRYEPNIYSAYLEKILDEQPVEERYEGELEIVREGLAEFIPLSPEFVPETTVLREFLP